MNRCLISLLVGSSLATILFSCASAQNQTLWGEQETDRDYYSGASRQGGLMVIAHDENRQLLQGLVFMNEGSQPFGGRIPGELMILDVGKHTVVVVGANGGRVRIDVEIRAGEITDLSVTIAPAATGRKSRAGRASAATANAKGLAWIPLPEGTFQMGSNRHADHEKPAHTVHVSAFAMLRTEVTVAQYEECMNAGRCSHASVSVSCNRGRSDRANHPMNCINWDQAQTFCEWVGGWLPTEAEWEYAAKGGEDGGDRDYPWGNEEPTCERAVMRVFDNGNICGIGSSAGCGKCTTWPVCSKPAGNTPQGLCDMAGNAAEWVADWYRGDYYARCVGDCGDPDGPTTGDWRVARGGSFDDFYPDMLRTTSRGACLPLIREPSAILGFRCAKEL
ncbi:MAG: SUMF1/EgtB/PvdO family nonheme iron enzyme [Pseudomonadota bacterium]